MLTVTTSKSLPIEASSGFKLRVTSPSTCEQSNGQFE